MRMPLSARNEGGLTLRWFARLRFVSLICVAQMLFLPLLGTSLRAQTANVIIPDGRTGTSLQTSGNVTNITTTTVSGANAFNSFSQFGVGQGNTVNLQVPSGSQNLINIVRDAPAYVNGTLNSYQNGKIGGNVYFADPYGFVVGKTGVVNVGSLNVSTPSKEFTDSIIGAAGQINNAAVSSLMNGSFPISPDGNIRILGRVNAADGVRLTGQNVFVGGGRTQRERVNQEHASKFAASVNSKGLRSASGITVRNGSIRIGVVNNATISGRLTARSRTTTPSTITVTAGNNIQLGKNASLSTAASKTGDAGNITLKATNDLTVKSGARINASSATGNAAIVDLSANGIVEIANGVKVNVAAPNGNAGKLVLDPTDTVVGAAIGVAGVNTTNASVANAISALNGTGTFTLLATNSITINGDGVVDGGTTVNVTLNAPTLSLLAGSYLRGDTVTLTSNTGSSQVNINAASNGGAQVLTNTALQINASRVVLSSTANMIVGNAATDLPANTSAAGYVSNATIARYAGALAGGNTLTLDASSQITVGATGIIDGRHMTGGVSSGNSLRLTLAAPTINIDAGAQVLAQAVNTTGANATSYTSGSVIMNAFGAGSSLSVSGTVKGAFLGFQTDQGSITVGSTAVILADPTRVINFGGPAISVNTGASITGSTVGFFFAHSALAVGGASLAGGNVLANNGQAGVLSNAMIANYIAAVNGSDTLLLSATANTLNLNADAVINAGSTMKVALQARTLNVTSGAQITAGAAAFAFDQDNVIIGSSADPSAGSAGFVNNTQIASLMLALSGTSAFEISANNSITLNATAVIDSRSLNASQNSQANSRNVSLSAPTITMAQGSKILAQAVNFGGSTFTSGNVSLNASSSHNLLSGQATAVTGITVDGQITGGHITINASSTAVSSFTSTILGTLALVGESIAPALLGLNGGYVAASATATVNINSHANINGTGGVVIRAIGSELAEDPVLAGLVNFMPFSAAVVVGKIDANISTNVASGATISAGGNLSILATNDATMKVSAISAGSSQFVETIAYSKVSVATTANVATGANLSIGTVVAGGSTLSVRALNNNSFSTSATSVALSTPGVSGGAGGALAISDITTSATALLGASLGTSGNRLNGSVVVDATSNGKLNSTMSSTIVGTPALVNALQEAVVSTLAPDSMIFKLMGPLFSASFNMKFAAAMSFTDSTQNATAAIAQNPSGGAPTIYAAGNVAVISNVIDVGVRSNSTASAITSDVSAGEGVAISAAVAWGTYKHNSNAYIGAGTQIDAQNIGVVANTYLPITNTWLQWAGLGEVISHLNGNLGVGGNILTSYANATADAGDTVGIAGSINNFMVNNNTTAWVATGASLNATCSIATCGNGAWTAASWAGTQDFSSTLAIAANTTTNSIDAAGNVGTLGFLPGNTSGGSSLGGALNLVQFSSNTIAGVASGASLSSADNISIDAVTTDLFFGVAPTSGKAAGALALNGITSIALVSNKTHASIGIGAHVSSPTLNVHAAQDLSMLSIAGAVSAGGSSAVGIAVAYLGATTDTAAYIGENQSDIRPGPFSANDPFSGNGGGNGTIAVDHLAVSATTSGRMTAASIAGALSEPSVSDFASKAGAVGAAATGGADGVAIGMARISQSSGASGDSFTINIAGSSSISDVSLGTKASITGVTINRFTASSTGASTLVQALNDTVLNNGSGSAAANLAGSEASGSVAIAGAIAVAMSNNATVAYIDNTTINNHAAVSVQALNGGSETVVAIGIAASRSISIAIALSVGIITDSVNAYIQNSTLNGVSSGTSRAVEVDAYQTSNIAIGGGSLYVSGGKGGVGAGFTYASIGDPTGGTAVDAHIRGTSINNYDTLTVLGDNASVIAAGAASGGAGGNGAAGAIVVTDITTSTLAYISSSATVNISVTGNVIVTADSVAIASLDTALSNLVKASNANQLASDNCSTTGGQQNCVDFSYQALNGGTAGSATAPGAAIVAVAGIIQAGKNNVGASMVYDHIATTHSAYIAGVLLTSTSGAVAVTASDSSEIQSVAIGFGLSTGQFSGVGGLSINSIQNTVTASVGNAQSTTTNSTITTANGLSVTANDTSKITGTAAVAGASTQGSAAGLALVYSDISNNLSAGITGSKVVSSSNVGVSTKSDATISTVAVGVAISSQVGLAGSVATNLMGTNVTANITGGADVIADGSIAVQANNTDNAAVFAGAFAISKGAAGGAGSLVTNKITGNTSAYISGSATKVDARGNSTQAAGPFSVNSGTLAHALNLGAFSAPTDDTPDLTETRENVRGLSVNASSHQAVVANVASLAASTGVSIMINPIINVMSGTTSAYIDGASIDTRLTSSTLVPQINVAASSISYSGTFGLGIVAPTGTAGGGATIISTTMSRETFAHITNAEVGGTVNVGGVISPTVGAVTVKANAEQHASSVAVGFNSGSVGLNVFNATTQAYVDGGSLTASSLSVKAKNSTGIASANGSGAYGSNVAIGAAFLVQVSSNKTLAYIGDEFHYRGNGAAHTTALQLTGALEVDARTKNDFQAFSVGGAISTGGGAVAGMANIEIANNVTIAGIYDTTLTSPTGTAAGAISVNANEEVYIREIAGALSVATGGVGVGAAANVLVFKSQTTAETRNSNLNSSGAINVNAQSIKEVQSYAVTVGAGSSVGIGAAIGVILIGTNTADADTQGDQTGQFGGTITAANAGTNSSQGSGAVASGTAGNPSGANATSTYDVSTVLTGGNDSVTAQIAGGNVTGTQVNVNATSANAAQQFLLGAGFGKNVGVGAGIGYTTINSSVLANLSAIVSAPTVSVAAIVKDATTGPYAGKTVDTEAIAGGLSLYFGAQASVAVGNVSNTVTAQLGGTVTGTGGIGVQVSARDTSTQAATAGGGSGGVAAIGVTIATTAKSSSVAAKILDNASVNSSTVAVTASQAGELSASATAVAGGILSGTGAAATAREDSTVLAEIGNSATITTSTTGLGTLVAASATPVVSASSLGVAVGGLALGVSVALSSSALNVTSRVGNSTTFTGGDVSVTAMALAPSSGNGIYARAIAGGGGSLVGVQGSYAETRENSTVSAYGGTGITLPAGDFTIAAENDSNQYATATGITAGYIAAGATISKVTSNATTEAYLGARAITTANHIGVLQITAVGTDTLASSATAGSGGTIAGAAAVALINNTATTSANLYGNATSNTLYLGGLNVQAQHQTNYAGNGDAYQASFAGASGGNSTSNVTSTTTAGVGTNLIIHSAGGDMLVISNDIVNQVGGGARAGSGGVAAGAATVSDAHVTQRAATNIGSGTILSLNDDPLTSTAKVNIEAYNSLRTVDSASLTAGGLFAGGGGQSNMTANAYATVNIDATEIFSAGNLFIGTASSLIAYNYANANLFGAITGAGASTNTSLTANQAVNVSGDTTLVAWGLLNLTAGQAGDGSKYSQVSANATTVVYNQAVIPITAVYKGTATARSYTDLNIAGGAKVLGVNNVSLAATKGAVSATGKGTNYNPYLSLFSTENHDNHSDASQGRANISQNGVVVAGIYNQESILIAVGASTPTLTTTSPYALTLELISDPNNFSAVKKYNHQTIQYAVVNGFNPYQTIVAQLATLSGLSTADVQTALLSAQPTITIATASDPTGDIQRQVNTLIQQAPFAANVAGSSIALGDILVSGGNVSILAETMSGAQVAGKPAPSITSRDSVSINIENQGLNYMSVSKLSVSGVSGGHNFFTGAATDTTSPGITFQQDLTGSTPIVSVNASYNRKDPNTGLGVDLNGVLLTKTPDIYFNGTVTNVNGLLNIANALGNVVASQTYNAATIQVQVPNGTFTVNGGVGSIYNTNNAVASQWIHTQFRPTDTLTAVMTAATWLGTYGQYVPGEVYLAGNGNYKPYSHYCCFNGNGVGTAVAPNSTVFTARMLNLYYDGVSLYSAIFLPAGEGIPGNLAQIEGASANLVSTAPWERNTYNGQTVYGDSGSPFHCSGCAAFFQVINIQSAAVTPLTATAAVNPPAAGTFAVGKAIILSASVLNINGTIQSGQSSNYSVNIGTNARNIIDSLRGDTFAGLSLAQAQSNAQHGNYLDLTPYLNIVNGGDVPVGARYNVLTDQIVLNSVVQGSGGYVYLNGRIISTSTSGSSQGNIVVNGGAGTITVNNQTGKTLVTNTINTGVSAASVIQIVDQLKQQTTWYVYNAGAPGGQQVSTYRTAGVNASGYNAGMLVGLSGPSGVTYSPLANQYYQWVDTATLTRPVTSTAASYGWTFSGVSANAANYPYTQTTALVSNVMQVVNGVATNQLQTANFQEVITATGGYHSNNFNTGSGKCCGSDRQYDWFQMIYDSLTLQMTNTVKASYDIGIHFNGGGSSSVAVTSDASIVINGPINNLQGVTTVATTGANSSITVGATANNPLISGTNVTLTAPGGIGSLAGSKTPVPVQVYSGKLTAISDGRDIAIAALGSLVIDQVRATSTTLGASPGNIFLSATGDINSGAPYNAANPVVIGKSIEINSTGGAIGAVSSVSNGATVLTNVNPLVVKATGTTLLNGSVDGGLLDSTSSTGTYIVQSTGDLRLGRVSSGGAVFLAAAASDGGTANILNGLSAGGLTAEQSAHLQSVWTELNLVNGSAAASVTAYESMIKAAYNDYWQLRNLAFADGNTYALTSLGTTVLKAQVAAKLGIDPADVSTTQMMTEATTRFERAEFLLGIKSAAQLSNSLTTLFGANLASNASLQAAPDLTVSLTAFDPHFSYSLSTNSTLYATIRSGSQWTQDQLKYTVSAAANPATAVAPAPIGELTPANVSGRQVMLYAPNGSIGNLARPEDFSFNSSTGSSTLSDVQKALLASAGPSQLTVTPTTDPVTGVITYNVRVSQQSYVVLNPLDAVAAKVQSDVYLASKSDLKLGGIANATFGPITGAQSNGVQTTGFRDVKLDAVGSIFAGAPNQVVISGNIRDLTLISETGNIGQAPAAGTNPANNPNALQVAFTNPSTNQLDQVVSAQGGIYLKQTTGDLVLGNVTAAGAIQFAATGSIYAEPQFTDRTAVHFAGATLDVRAGGNVGFNGTTAQPLQVKITGAITGTSVGAMTILAPSNDLNIGATGTYGVLTAGGAMTLSTAVGALNINADVTSDGLMQLLANGAVTFVAGTSADPIVAQSTNGAVTLASASLTMGAFTAINAAGVITVATTGDATLGQLNSSASYAAAGNAASIVVSAGGVSAGAILSNADGQTNLVASGANARVTLNASSIGTSSQRVTLNAPFLAATATDGGIYIGALADLEASLLSAVKGTVDVLGSGSLTLDNVLAGTATGANGTFTALATTSGSNIFVGSAASSGSQRLHADGNVTFNQLTAKGVGSDPGDITVNADRGFVLAQTVVNGGVTTLGSVAAHGSASLTAGTTITGATLAATTGSASLVAAGLIDWTTLTAGTTLGMTSTAGSITLKTAQSGGSQTLHASQNVTFNQQAAIGITGDVGSINVNADNGFILAQTVVASGVTTPGSVAANGSASLTAATTITGTTLATTTGSASLQAAGLIDWTALTAATTLGINSTGSSITLRTAQSGGSQTLHANQNVTFNQLAANGITGDVGNINVNAANGFILAQTVVAGGVTTPGSVAANGSASLTAGTTISGTTLATTTGSASLVAVGLIDWTTLTAGTTLGIHSTASSINLASAQSGGKQTLHARQNVTFNQLTTSGIAGDAGNVNINADTGKLAGGSINAHGSANLIAATTNTGNDLTTATGSALLQGTLIDWTNLNVAGTLGGTATANGITLGTAISGGTQSLQAHGDIVFKQLTANGIPGDAGDVNLRSDFGSILGGSVYADGDTHFDTAGSISLDQVRGNTVALSAPGDLTIKWVGAVKRLDLAANTINIVGGQIPSMPMIPLVMNVTGYKGGVATSANLNIDPDTIIVNQFKVVDANFVTDAPNVTIVDGFVPGQLMLTTLTQRILLDNRSPSPSNWATLQLYQPAGVFTMSHNGNANVSDSYVVLYNGDISATVTNYVGSHTCCARFTGSMAIRNIANDTQGTETFDTWLAQKSGAETFYLLGLAGNARLEALLTPKPVEVIGSGPAVNIEGLTEARKLRQLQREGRKNGRPGWNSTGVDERAKGDANRFADARANGNPLVQF